MELRRVCVQYTPSSQARGGCPEGAMSGRSLAIALESVIMLMYSEDASHYVQ